MLYRILHPEQGYYHRRNRRSMPIAEYTSELEAKVQRDRLNPPITDTNNVGPWQIVEVHSDDSR